MIGKFSRFRAGAGGAAIVTLILVGCATQSYEPAPIDAEAEATAFSARRLDDSALQRFAQALRGDDGEWPPRQWHPGDLFTAALFYRDEFGEARAEWRARRADVQTAQRRPPLGVNLTAEHDSDPDESGASPWTIGALLDFVLPGPGKREARVDAARARADAGRWALGEAAWQTRERIHRRFLALHDLRRRVRLGGLERVAAQEATQLLEHRQSLGETGGLEVTAMRLRLQRSRLDLATAQSDVVSARIALASAVGVPPAALDAIRTQLAEPERPLPDPDAGEIRAAGLKSRYDVRRALAEYAAADAELRAAVAEQYPDITLSPGILFDQDDRVWVLDASWLLKLPGHNDGPIAAARARRDAAASRFRSLQARVIGNIERALADYRGRLRVLATAEDVLAAQREHESQIQARFDAGYVDRLMPLTAKIETLAARRARHEAWVAAHKSLAALETAAQTALTPDANARARIARFVRNARKTERADPEEDGG